MASKGNGNGDRWGYSGDTRRAMANVSGDDDREVTIWLPDRLADEIEAEVRAGRYPSVPEAVEEAIAQFVDSDSDGDEGGDGDV